MPKVGFYPSEAALGMHYGYLESELSNLVVEVEPSVGGDVGHRVRLAKKRKGEARQLWKLTPDGFVVNVHDAVLDISGKRKMNFMRKVLSPHLFHVSVSGGWGRGWW